MFLERLKKYLYKMLAHFREQFKTTVTSMLSVIPVPLNKANERIDRGPPNIISVYVEGKVGLELYGGWGAGVSQLAGLEVGFDLETNEQAIFCYQGAEQAVGVGVALSLTGVSRKWPA